jgi:hypothetical protein
MMVIVEQLVGETEVLGENQPQCHFVHHKSYMTRSWLETGPSPWEANLAVSCGPRFHKPLCGLYYKLITYSSDMITESIFIKQNVMVYHGRVRSGR